MAHSHLQSRSSASFSSSRVTLDAQDAFEPEKSGVYKGHHVNASVSEIPRRKPVPVSSTVAVPKTDLSRSTLPSLFAGLSARYRRLDKRRKRLVVIIAVMVTLGLLGLIVGLSVGLTSGSEAAADLTSPNSPYKGDLTYYQPGLGACGITSSASDHVCAISKDLYDAASTSSNPNDNPFCGVKIRLYTSGKQVDVKIVDRCEACKLTDIDVPKSVFKKLANPADGRVPVQWVWVDNPPIKMPDA